MEDFFYGTLFTFNNGTMTDSKNKTSIPTPRNISSDPDQVIRSPQYNRQLRIIVMTIIFAVAMVGNTAVLYKICSGKDKKRKINFLITHLALADLYVSLVTLLSQIIWELLEDEWLVGDVACRIFKVLQASGLIASSNIIAIVALERHNVIMNPLSTPLPTRCFAAVGWLLSLLLAVPQAYVFRLTSTEKGYRCQNIFGHLPRWHFQAYIIYSSVNVFFVPFCILTVAYSRILWVIWRKGMEAKNPKDQNGDSELQDSRSKVTKRPLRLVAINSCIPRAKVKTLKMTLVIIILFIVCGLPYFVVEMKVAFGTITSVDEQVMAVLGIFVVTNSAVNPYVYLFFKSSNVFLSRLEKKVCFVCCLKEYREINVPKELFPSCAPTPRRDPSSTTTTDVEASTLMHRSVSFLPPQRSSDRETSRM